MPVDTSALGKINHFIPRDLIDEFKREFNIERDSLAVCRSGLYIPVSEAFNKPAVLEILKDPKCVGLKIYYGVKKNDNNKEMRVMLV